MKIDSPPFRLGIKVIPIFLFLVFIFQLFWHFNEMWLYGHQGFSGALRGIIARNYLRYGLIKTKLAPVKNPEPNVKKAQFKYHFHHPPFINILVALSFWIFGESEGSARIIPILCSLATAFLLWLFVQRQFGSLCGVMSLLFFVLNPMTFNFASMVNYEPLGLLFCVLLAIYYHKWNESQKPRHFGAIFIFILLGAFTDWPCTILPFILAFHYLLFGRARFKCRLLFSGGIGIFTLLCLGLILYWMSYLAGGWVHLLRLFNRRVTKGIDLNLLILKEAGFLIDGFGIVLFLLSFLWVINYSCRFFKGRANKGEGWPLFFLGQGLLYILVFHDGARIHLFFRYYLLPFFAVASGMICSQELRKTLLKSPLLGKICFISLVVLYIIQVIPHLARHFGQRYGLGEKRTKRVYFDAILLAKEIERFSLVSDQVSIHGSISILPQMVYYMNRRWQRVYSQLNSLDYLSSLKSHVLVLPVYYIPKDKLAVLFKSYSLLRFEKYLIIDLSSSSRQVSATRIRYKRSDIWWRYLYSSFYPRFEIISDPFGVIDIYMSAGAIEEARKFAIKNKLNSKDSLLSYTGITSLKLIKGRRQRLNEKVEYIGCVARKGQGRLLRFFIFFRLLGPSSLFPIKEPSLFVTPLLKGKKRKLHYLRLWSPAICKKGDLFALKADVVANPGTYNLILRISSGLGPQEFVLYTFQVPSLSQYFL
jgi:hypothetical protein